MKNKILKTCFVGCLATCLTLTGIFAFAPLGASAQASSNSQNHSLNSNLNNSTTSTTEQTGLITPHADDPVLFTTESGLEIKYGNATFQTSLASGYLSRFPYISTSDGTKDYIWVMIGANLTGHTVAGNAILSDTNFNLAYVYGQSVDSSCFKDPKNEIPMSCGLFWANDVVANGAYGPALTCEISGNKYYGTYAGSSMDTVMQGYYTERSFGISEIKQLIQPMSLSTREWVGTNTTINMAVNGPLITRHIFAMGYANAENFSVNTYLYSSQYRPNTGGQTNFWFRLLNTTYDWSGNNCTAQAYYCSESSGSRVDSIATHYNIGYRPAFVMSLV